MSKQVVVFENDYKDFRTIYNSMSSIGTETRVFPKVMTDKDEEKRNFYDFVSLFQKYALGIKSNKLDRQLESELSNLIPKSPDLFILDMALLEPNGLKFNNLDNSGCIIRNSFLKPNFQKAPVLWISSYDKEIIQNFGCYNFETDNFINKDILSIYIDSKIKFLDTYIRSM